MSLDLLHRRSFGRRRVPTGSYQASWQGDVSVPYFCEHCGHRTEAVVFCSARGISFGVNASAEQAQVDASNRALDVARGQLMACACPRCGRHAPAVLRGIAMVEAKNRTRRGVRIVLASTMLLLLLAGMIPAVGCARGAGYSWLEGIGGGVLGFVALIGLLVAGGIRPLAFPVAFDETPRNVRFVSR